MDNIELKIRKGQAMNLAITEAIHLGKTNDTAFIYTQALHFMDIIDAFQGASVDTLKEIMHAV